MSNVFHVVHHHYHYMTPPPAALTAAMMGSIAPPITTSTQQLPSSSGMYVMPLPSSLIAALHQAHTGGQPSNISGSNLPPSSVPTTAYTGFQQPNTPTTPSNSQQR